MVGQNFSFEKTSLNILKRKAAVLDKQVSFMFTFFC